MSRYIPLPNRLLDAIHNIVDIIVSYVWAGRETEAYLEESGFHVVGVGCGACVNRLLVHRLPDRTSLDFLGKHEHAESPHIFVRLTISRRTIYSVNHACSAAHCGLDDLLVGIFNQSKATTNPPKRKKFARILYNPTDYTKIRATNSSLSPTVHEQSPRNSLSRTRRPPLTFWYSEGA